MARTSFRRNTKPMRIAPPAKSGMVVGSGVGVNELVVIDPVTSSPQGPEEQSRPEPPVVRAMVPPAFVIADTGITSTKLSLGNVKSPIAT